MWTARDTHREAQKPECCWQGGVRPEAGVPGPRVRQGQDRREQTLGSHHFLLSDLIFPLTDCDCALIIPTLQIRKRAPRGKAQVAL